MPLTWQNVAAPDFSSAIAARRAASDSMNNGFGAITAALAQFEQNRMNDAKFQDEHRRALLGDETVRLQNTGLGFQQGVDQFKFDTTKRDDSLAQARLAAQPEAAKILGQARLLSGSGDPTKIEEARSMLMGNSDLLVKAGFQSDAIPGLLDSARTAGVNGFGYKQDVLNDKKFWENQGISEDAQSLATKAITDSATPDMAVRSIQEMNVDPRIKAGAIAVIQKAADAKVFATATPEEQFLTSLGMTPGSSVNAPSLLPEGAQLMKSLIRKTESNGADTLYANAQANDTPFAGVQVSKQTIGQLKQFSAADGPYGRYQKDKLGYLATPMGDYQIVGDTLAQTAKEMGLPDDTVFDQKTQDAMFLHLVNKRISGPKSMEGKMSGLRSEWEGFKNVSDADLSKAIQAFETGDTTALGQLTRSSNPSPVNVMLPTDYTPSNQVAVNDPRITQPIGTTNEAAQLSASVTPKAVDPVANSTTTQTEAAAKTESDPVKALREFDKQTQDAAVPVQDPARTAREDALRLINSDAWGNKPAPAQESAIASKMLDEAAQTTSKSDAKTDIQNLSDQTTVDRVFNRNGALIKEFANASNSTETADQVAARMTKEGGLMPSGNHQAVLAAINETIALSKGQLNPAAAGALVANNSESRDLTDSYIDLWPGADSWFDGDRFSNSTENLSSATRTNMDGVQQNLKDLGANVDGSIDVSKATAAIQNDRRSAVSAQQLPQIQKMYQDVVSKVATLQSAVARGQDTPAIKGELASALIMMQQLQEVINQIGAQPGSSTTIFTDAAKTVPGN